jgi:hypothetical protein
MSARVGIFAFFLDLLGAKVAIANEERSPLRAVAELSTGAETPGGFWGWEPGAAYAYESGSVNASLLNGVLGSGSFLAPSP